jgi:hypothetical protein
MRPMIALLLAFLTTIQTKAADSSTELATIFLPREEEMRLALDAAPEHLRAEATVYVFGTTGYSKVRTGTNGFTCLVNRDGNQQGDHDLKPTCWDPEGSRTILPVMLRVGELLAANASPDVIQHDIETRFAKREFSSPQKAGVAYMLKGDLQYDPATRSIAKTAFPPHYMIYAPGVTNVDIGADMNSSRRNHEHPFVYDGYSGGTRTAYIIVPAQLISTHGTDKP